MSKKRSTSASPSKVNFPGVLSWKFQGVYSCRMCYNSSWAGAYRRLHMRLALKKHVCANRVGDSPDRMMGTAQG